MVTMESTLSGAGVKTAGAAPSDPESISVEVSSRRLGMSFQRTRMSAERTLMSVIRTSPSLIGFGFTIFQFFGHLRETNLLSGSGHAARKFGKALVFLGVGMLVIGIWYHIQFMLGLRGERERITAQHLIHGESAYPVSMTLIVAALLLGIGLPSSAWFSAPARLDDPATKIGV
jgi:putative membrane protein